MRDNKCKKEAHTLIEALIALGILLLGIVPVVTLATQAMMFHHRAAEAEEAARLSQTIVDYIKSRGYDELELMVSSGTGTFEKKYETELISGTTFTIREFGSVSNFNIPQDMIILNSKGINLNQVSFYVILDSVKGSLKKSDKVTEDKYVYPPTGENINNAYEKNLIYGKLIFGIGEDGQGTNTGREKELITTFIMTPIENWK